jgi:glycosyltransferase involved in cell wall biosynthesis
LKVVIVSGVYYPNIFGGTERAAQRLAEGLVARGHDVSVAALTWRKPREVANVNGVRVHYLPLKNVYFPGRPMDRSAATKLLWRILDTYNPIMSAALGRVFDIERPDVVNMHNIGGFSPLAWREARARRLPLVNTTHGLDLLCPFFLSRDGATCQSHCTMCRMYALPRVRMSRDVNVLTGVSRYLIDEYERHGAFPNAKKMVIYNASPSVSALSRPSCESVVRFGFLGRLHASKGIELLVREHQRLKDARTELVVAGSGRPEYERSLKPLANGSVRWLGHVDPQELFRQIDVLVVPSVLNDSAPMAILEALAHGLPVIGSRRGGIPELLGADTGWLFDPDEPGALAAAMQGALDSRENLTPMGRRAQERAQQFCIERMIEGYLQAYSLAIDNNRAN